MQKKKTVSLKKADIFVYMAVIFLAIGIAAFCLGTKKQGLGKSALIITVSGQQETIYLTDQVQTRILSGAGYTMQIEFSSKQVRVICCDCPDQICVHTAPITENGEWIACVPAKILLWLQFSGESYDGIAG